MTRLPFPLSDIRLPRAPDTPKNERPLPQIPANRRHPRPQNGTGHSPTGGAVHLETTRRIPNRHTLKTSVRPPNATPARNKRNTPGTAHSQYNPPHTQPPHPRKINVTHLAPRTRKNNPPHTQFRFRAKQPAAHLAPRTRKTIRHTPNHRTLTKQSTTHPTTAPTENKRHTPGTAHPQKQSTAHLAPRTRNTIRHTP